MLAKRAAKKRRKPILRKYATPAQQAARAEILRLSGVKLDPKLLAEIRALWED